jgi:ribosomal protein S18 acetylase RimI-like enzyme
VCIIRKYSPADWPHVCRVHDLARVVELRRGGVDARAFDAMADAAEGDEFFVSETLVACLEDVVVGFISWNGAYMTWLYVDPAYHRRGVGRRLVRAALQRIGPEAWTNSLGGNDAAVNLYRKSGMEIVWTRASLCDGYLCTTLRLALPTSRMRDPDARRQSASSGGESG